MHRTPTVRKKVAAKLESSSGMKLLLYAMALVQLGALSPTTSSSRPGSTTYLPPTQFDNGLTQQSDQLSQGSRRKGKSRAQGRKEDSEEEGDRLEVMHKFTFDEATSIYERCITKISSHFMHRALLIRSASSPTTSFIRSETTTYFFTT